MGGEEDITYKHCCIGEKEKLIHGSFIRNFKLQINQNQPS